MLNQLPIPVRHLLLAIAGTLIAAAINWAIYRFAYTRKRNISPWQTPDPKATARTWVDRVPILGWWNLRRDSAVHGRGFWIRPLLIELTWLIALPWFYSWQISGGLTDGYVPKTIAMAETWFLGHMVLFALLTAATFIDFDEKMIPDGVTVVGFVFALVFAAVAPSFRLPETTAAGLGFAASIAPIHFNSPGELPSFHRTWLGILIGAGVMTIWFLAMLPKLNPRGKAIAYLGAKREGGFVSSLTYMIASVTRPPRQSENIIGERRRGPKTLTKILAIIWIISLIAIPAVALSGLPTAHWDSLFGALVGLAVGGGMIWGVRIVAGLAAGQEAMGFGDVILMAMIGAFVGWQPTPLIFVFAPFAAILIVITSFLVTGNNQLPFGPYLSLATLFVIFFWPAIWPWAANGIFRVSPGWLAALAFGGLLLMGLMMFGLVALRGEPDDEEFEASSDSE